jgi:hypothetical protein
MIRRSLASDVLLFTQHEHALLSGRLAERIDGRLIARPSPRTVEGISLHDCGWPLHDDHPTLNPHGQPLHVFETPVHLSTQVWTASAQRAAAKDPYAGLLVSLHVLNLSGLAAQSHQAAHETFEINKFQHQQIELQEQLRHALGLRIDRPLNRGLARPGTSPAEDALRFDYHLLRAMDQLSLALLCAEDVFASLDGIDSRPGGTPLSIRLQRLGPFRFRLNPWPFDDAILNFAVPGRRIPARTFHQTEDFRNTYENAPIDEFGVVVQA